MILLSLLLILQTVCKHFTVVVLLYESLALQNNGLLVKGLIFQCLQLIFLTFVLLVTVHLKMFGLFWYFSGIF